MRLLKNEKDEHHAFEHGHLENRGIHMKSTKKLKQQCVCLLLATILLVTSGCVSKTNSGNAKDTKSAFSTNSEPDPNKKYEYDFTFYQTAPIANDPKMVKYYEDNFNVKFNVWDIEATKRAEIIGQRIIGGEIPDVFNVDQVTWKKYIDQNVVAEIPMELLEKYAPNIFRIYKEFAPQALELGKVNGKLYSLPNFNVNGWRAPVAYRQDWLDNLGMKVPETIDEFEKVIYAIAKNDPDKNGKNDTYGISITSLMPVFGAYGQIPFITGQGGNVPGNGFWNEKDGKLVYGAVQPEMKEVLERVHKWYADGVLDPEFVTGENQGGYWALSHSFINGRIGVSGIGLVYHWQPQLYADTKPGVNLEELAKVNPNAKVALGNPPKGPFGQGTFAGNMISLPGICFGKKLAKEPDRMARLLQIYDWEYTNYSNYNTAFNGIEGVDWEYAEKKALDGQTDKSIVALGKFKDGKLKGSNFMGALSLFSPIFPDDPTSNNAIGRWKTKVNTEKFHIENKLSVPLPSEGQYKSELEKLVVETYFAIILGTKSIDDFDRFVNDWNRLGGKELTKEANEWYATAKK